MVKRLIAELIIRGTLREVPEEDAIKEDINPSSIGCIPCLDWRAIQTDGKLDIDCLVENGSYSVTSYIDLSNPDSFYREEWVNENITYPGILEFTLTFNIILDL